MSGSPPDSASVGIGSSLRNVLNVPIAASVLVEVLKSPATTTHAPAGKLASIWFLMVVASVLRSVAVPLEYRCTLTKYNSFVPGNSILAHAKPRFGPASTGSVHDPVSIIGYRLMIPLGIE